MKIEDFPKIESPFERELKSHNNYVVIPKLKPEFAWIFTEDCLATDKLDGTNVSVFIEKGNIIAVFNRTSRIDIWKSGIWFYEGIKRAIDENKFNLDLQIDGQYFGELIGERINGNPYKLQGHLWVPFDYIKKHYYFKFWEDFRKDAVNLNELEQFEKVSELFKNLWSIFKRQRGMKENLESEGIVFHNKKSGEMCKLRRDMFSFWNEQGNKSHKQIENREEFMRNPSNKGGY